MNNVYEIGGEEDRAVEASDWIAKLDKGLSSAETAALQAWIRTDSRNEIELLAMAQMWDKMDTLSRLSEVFPHPGHEGAPNTAFNYRWLAVAASIALFALVGLLAIFNTNVIERERDLALVADVATYETAIGGLSKVELSDGSRIILNTNSRAEVSFNERQRLIKLERGEIHIDVAHDTSRPLSVIVGRRVVQAVGTAFSVKIDESQRIEVLVADGRVRIGVHAKETAELRHLRMPGEITGESLVVAKGERVVLDDSSEELDVMEPEEIEVRLSWRDGNLVFRGESLAVAAAEVSRYTPVEFVFVGEDLQKIRVAGLFKAGDVAGFLSSLKANFDIAYERVDDQTILLSTTKDASN